MAGAQSDNSVESEAPPQQQRSEESDDSVESEVPPQTLGNNCRFIQHTVSGIIFELTSKYGPPMEVIGNGAYGLVCEAMNAETKQGVAVKKIANAFHNRIDAKRTLREIRLTRHMDHENVVTIRDVIPPPQRDAFNDVYVVYELMQTDLDKIIRSKQELSDAQCQAFLYQILRGLKYIHSANVIHRDLKPGNILLNTEDCHLKIADFGLARVKSETVPMTQHVVSRWYRAPELLLTSSNYTEAIDVWSVGCIFMEILDQKPLFKGDNDVHQIRLILELLGTPTEAELEGLHDDAKAYIRKLPPFQRPSFHEKFPDIADPLALHLVEKMLTFDPRQRITVEDALAHLYLDTYHDSDDEPVCETPVNDDFEQQELSEDQIKELIYQEALAYNPEFK